ncbi:MAG: hypothetical protein V3U66_05435 [Acidobacteriota bacterium]
MQPTAAKILAVILFLVLLPGVAGAVKTTKVTIQLPIPQKLDLEGIHTVLVTDFYVEQESDKMDIGSEVNKLLRRELEKYTDLDILDITPPHLPEQSHVELLNNHEFWKDLARMHGADLIISGGVVFDVFDRSAFVEETTISPTTGQRIRTTRFRERESYSLGLNLFFVRGVTGAPIYENLFSEELLLDGTTSDHLTILFNMFDRIRPEVLSIVAPQSRREQRILLSD